MDPASILVALKRLGATHDRIAAAIGRDRTAATKMLNGTRSMKLTEVPALEALVAELELENGESPRVRNDTAVADEIAAGLVVDYVPIQVLPTYAGMGGGGTGDGDGAVALLPRQLVELELRARPEDLLVINLRGDSDDGPGHWPRVHDGDQVVVDKRDCNPVQPGPFALWDGDGYVLKNVERVRGLYRVFSTNPAYTEQTFDPSEVQIMGRPRWFARALGAIVSSCRQAWRLL